MIITTKQSVNMRQIREEDCETFDIRKAYDLIKQNKSILAVFDNNHVIVNSQSFLTIAIELIGPLPDDLDQVQRIIIEQNFISACQHFTGLYSSVMLILKKDKDG